MYETEANQRVESSDQIPAEVLAAFRQFAGKIEARTVLPWGEHCTECVWPTCYTTCDLYAARPDGKCRRFADGMVRIDAPETLNSYLLKIRFKRWGKLWTPGNIHLTAMKQAAKLERRDYRIGRALTASPLPSLIKISLGNKRYGFKKRVAASASPAETLPTSFLVECYNPSAQEVQLSLTMRSSLEGMNTPFQKLLRLAPGFHRERISAQEIAAFVDLRQPFGIELIPNEDADSSGQLSGQLSDEPGETTLYFGLMDFVSEVAAKTAAVAPSANSTIQGEDNDKKGKEGKDDKEDKDDKDDEKDKKQNAKRKVKCVVWDLDHTLWDGVLVEDGIDRLRLKPGVAAVLEALDQRGILHSIASKNNSEDAMQAVRKFQLEQYFLCPQISWGPKSQALETIAQQLNIGLDSLLFIDDSAFEREEVRSACPQAQLLDAARYLDLPGMEECQVPVTDESRERRKMYQVEAGRQAIAENFSHDYMAFLRHCEIELTLRPMTEDNLERVHELTQRTNQMNFSGNRYDRAVLRELLATPYLDTFVLSCKDRFGSYGVIGFSVVDRREPRMTDLMFSCRVQSKRVEHAFLSWLMRKYIAETGRDFYADYRKTPRNAPSGKVFADLHMQELGMQELGMQEQAMQELGIHKEQTGPQKDGVLSLKFPHAQEVPDDGVIHIVATDLAHSSNKNQAQAALQETSA